MRISIVIKKIEFDAKGFVTSTFKSLRQQMLQAAAEFVHFAAPNVPVVTGMARGSFLNMLQLLDSNTKRDLDQATFGRDLGAYARAGSDRGIPTTAQKRRGNGRYLRYKHTDGEDYRKEPITAKKFTTSRGQIITRLGEEISFKYDIDVRYFNYMDESNPYTDSWQSIRRGKEAFNQTIQAFKPIGVTKYMVVTTQTGTNDGEGGTKTVRNQKTVK